jgi:hypothetical protein
MAVFRVQLLAVATVRFVPPGRCTNLVHPYYPVRNLYTTDEVRIMAHLPTWHGQTVTQDNIQTVTREAFDTVQEAMGAASMTNHTKDELLHFLEAAAYLGAMAFFTNAVALPAARDTGASWAELGAAMGTSRSSAKSRYKKAIRD